MAMSLGQAPQPNINTLPDPVDCTSLGSGFTVVVGGLVVVVGGLVVVVGGLVVVAGVVVTDADT